MSTDTWHTLKCTHGEHKWNMEEATILDLTSTLQDIAPSIWFFYMDLSAKTYIFSVCVFSFSPILPHISLFSERLISLHSIWVSVYFVYVHCIFWWLLNRKQPELRLLKSYGNRMHLPRMGSMVWKWRVGVFSLVSQ